MIAIDGAQGEGGGQIVRSSLAMSMVTGRAVTINQIRAGRRKPGLKRQHLTAVRAAAKICAANVVGDALGSSRLVFEPGEVSTGEYHFRIGTAGSTTLVLQTVLPALMIASEPSWIVLEGGTHNAFAPPFDFLSKVYLPLLSRMGPQVEATLVRPGFFPVGEGEFSVTVQPASHLKRLELLERGRLLNRRLRAIVSQLPRQIAERECRRLAELSGWEVASFEVEEVFDSRGPGNVVLLELDFQHHREVFTGFGQKGIRAETVVEQLWQEASHYLDSEAAVGEYLADQLILPLGLSVYLGGKGGSFCTLPLSSHSTTHLDVLRMFVDLEVDLQTDSAGLCTVRIH